MSSGPQSLVGSVLDRRYRIVRLLGKGGMGFVYEGVHVTLDRRIAVKTLHPRLAYEERFRERFLREAKSASKVRHPNVVQIMDFGDTPDGSVYFVMEYLEGRDLGSLLREHGRLSWARARPILLQTVRALAAAHKHGIIHRDIKPANCFLYDSEVDGIRGVVKVLDFGIAKAGADTEQEGGRKLTGTGEVFGTASYMAPEQARGEPLDARSDIYSLGIMAYEMLTGQVPFTGVNAIHVITRHLNDAPRRPRELEPRISPAVEALVLRAIAKEKRDRFASMEELAAALTEIPVEIAGTARNTARWGSDAPMPMNPRPEHPAPRRATAEPLAPKVRPPPLPPPPGPRTPNGRAAKTTAFDVGRPAAPKLRVKTVVDTAPPAVPRRPSPSVDRRAAGSPTASDAAEPVPVRPRAPRLSRMATIPAFADVPARRPKAATEPTPTTELRVPSESSPSRPPPGAGALALALPVSVDYSTPDVLRPVEPEVPPLGVPTRSPSAARGPSVRPALVPGVPRRPLRAGASGEIVATPPTGPVFVRGSVDGTTPPPGQVDHPTSPAPRMASSTSGTGPQSRRGSHDGAGETSPHRLEVSTPPSATKWVAIAVGLAALATISTAVTIVVVDGDPIEGPPIVKPAVTNTGREPPQKPRAPSAVNRSAPVEPAPTSVDPLPDPAPAEPMADVPDADQGIEAQEPPVEQILVRDDEESAASIDEVSRANHLTQACADRRAAAQMAYDEMKWPAVLKQTALASCWSASARSERQGLRVNAYLNLGNYAKCAAAGRYAKNPKIKQIVADCKEQLSN